MTNEILKYLEQFKFIELYFGEPFLQKAISNYSSRKTNSIPFYHLANFICWAFCRKHYEFFIELEEMLKYFYSGSHLQEYLLSRKVRKHLKSRDEIEFHSIWSELIFAFFLSKRDFEVIKIGQAKGEASEQADIVTNKGLFEVTLVLSEKDKQMIGEAFFGSNEVDEISKKLINNKIQTKINQNEAKNIVIDCTFMESLYEKLMTTYTIGIKTDFNVFRKVEKKVFLFIRNPHIHQLGILQEICI